MGLGSACSLSRDNKIIKTVVTNDDIAKCSLRISFQNDLDHDQIMYFIEAINNIEKKIKDNYKSVNNVIILEGNDH